jgi:hypothetical protein
MIRLIETRMLPDADGHDDGVTARDSMENMNQA